MQPQAQSENEPHNSMYETKCQTTRCNGEEDVSRGFAKNRQVTMNPTISGKQTSKEMTQKCLVRDLQDFTVSDRVITHHGVATGRVPRLGRGLADGAVQTSRQEYLTQPSIPFLGTRPCLLCHLFKRQSTLTHRTLRRV